MKPPPQQTRHPNEFLVGVEGEEVTPESFDVLVSLSFLHAFVQLMQSVAKAENRTLDFTGLRVQRGSVAFALQTDTLAVAEDVAEKAQLYVVGAVPTPRGLQTQVGEVRESLEHLPNVTPFYETREGRQSLPTAFPPGPTCVETTEFRAVVHRVGGVKPRVVLVVTGAEMELNLRAEQSIAQRAAKHLYGVVDAVVTLIWEGEKVVECELHDFTPVEDPTAEDEIVQWRRWFAEVGSKWDDVDDLSAELRGDIQ